jgi:hypothetical protein
VWVQKIDYWKPPFRCFAFHEVGHMKVACTKTIPLNLGHKKVWVKKAKESIPVLAQDESP